MKVIETFIVLTHRHGIPVYQTIYLTTSAYYISGWDKRPSITEVKEWLGEDYVDPPETLKNKLL